MATTNADSGPEPTLKVWRLHPAGCNIVPAEKSLGGTANRGGVRFCGPFTNANSAGWWVYSPVDMDVVWHGGDRFESRLLTPYTDDDFHLIRFLLREQDRANPNAWLPEGGRTKFSWGLVEEGVVQIWTGCIFQTPPGWGLQIRSPVNLPSRPFRVMEATLETDWLQYDIWLNLAFERPGELVELRREGWPPIAQLIPVARESYDGGWRLESELLHRNTGEASRVFEYFVAYNEKKFGRGGRHPILDTVDSPTKDSSTYFKERKRHLGSGTSPEEDKWDSASKGTDGT